MLCVPYDKLGEKSWWHGPRTVSSTASTGSSNETVSVSRAEWLHPAMRHSMPNAEHSILHAMLEVVRQPEPAGAADQIAYDVEQEVYVEALRGMVWSLEDAAQCQ